MCKKNKIAILGSTGLLGQMLMKKAQKRKLDVCGVARKNADFCFDITDDEKLVSFITQGNFDVVINTCAIVNHNICEKSPIDAYLINARPSAILAELSKEFGFKYVYISTDGYFNGDGNRKHDENSEVHLFNEYARTKYVGERFALTNPASLVIRTNIVGFRGDKTRPTFVEWVIDSLKNKKEMTLFDDYYTSSISVAQFSDALYDLLPLNPCGILNLASCEVSSKKIFIEEIAKVFDFDLSNTKIGSVKLLSESKRADSLGLDVSKAERILGYKLAGLSEVVARLKMEYDNVR